MWYYIKTDSESLRSLQEQAAESSEACCTGGEPLPPLKSKTIHAEFYCNGRLTESYLDWIESLRDQAVEYGVPFWLKQMVQCSMVESAPSLDGKQWL